MRTTPLHDLHAELGGRLVDFAGWELPIHYEGVLAEHTACRERAALFDVSHMGIVELRTNGSSAGTDTAAVATIAGALETLTPASIATVAEGRQRYALLTNETGGVIDDCIVTNRGDHIMMVVNAARRSVDLAHLRAHLDGIDVIERENTALLALQGPQAATVLGRFASAVNDMVFLDFAVVDLELVDETGSRTGSIDSVGVSRSGYTGEDGFELYVTAERATDLARALVRHPEVVPAGLGARDTLRLEAGLALYGHDLDETTSPVEADLVWTMPKRRREDQRFLGAERIMNEYHDGPSRRRVGLRPSGRRPVRDGTSLRVGSPRTDTATDTATDSGEPVGTVTSGGYGPTVRGPIAMGYVTTDLADEGQSLIADVRGRDVEVEVTSLPFVTTNYHRGT